jgi:sugar phosphate isomerase/epimerase
LLIISATPYHAKKDITMYRVFPRRRFLRQALTISTAAFGMSKLPALAIEPVKRIGSPKFKFSLAAYSYRELLSGRNPTLTLSDFVDDCAKMQLEATELTSYYFPDPVTPEYLRSLRQQCFHLGLDVSGTAVRNDFAVADDARRQRDIDHVKHWVDNSEMLGAPVIRVFAGYVPRGGSEAEAHKRIVAGLEECCDYAGQHGVHLALENHGGPTATAEGLLAIVRDVQSPWFGVNLDTGNFHTEDAYGDLERIAPYSLNVQIKVDISGPGGAKRPTDFSRLAKMLRDINYRGYIVLEYEESEDPRKVCPTYIDEIRAAFLG